MKYAPTNIDELSVYAREVGGWIAPDGTFFQAEYGDHYRVARKIVKGFLHESCSDARYAEYLLAQGWIRLETEGDITHGYDPTGQQVDTLFRLYSRAITGWYKDEMYKHVKHIMLDICHCWCPAPVPSQGDQENVNFTAWKKQIYA